MALIKVSEVVKEELEQLKKKGEFKSLDAVVRHYVNSSVRVEGGIFLGSLGSEFINLRNIRYGAILNNFTYPLIAPPTTIKLYKCLKCHTTTSQNECEPIIIPNCGGCGKGMTPITIQIGFPNSDKLEAVKLWARENVGEYLDNQNWNKLGEILDMNLDYMNMD